MHVLSAFFLQFDGAIFSTIAKAEFGPCQYQISPIMLITRTYSGLPNNCAANLILFLEKVHPAGPYLSLFYFKTTK